MSIGRYLGTMCTICTTKTRDLINAGYSDSDCGKALNDILNISTLPSITYICFNCEIKLVAYRNFKIIASEKIGNYLKSVQSDETQVDTNDEMEDTTSEEDSPSKVDGTLSGLSEIPAYLIPKPSLIQMNNLIEMNTDLMKEYKKLKTSRERMKAITESNNTSEHSFDNCVVVLERLTHKKCENPEKSLSKSTPDVKSPQILKCKAISTRRNQSFGGMSNIKSKMGRPDRSESFIQDGAELAGSSSAIPSTSRAFNVLRDKKYLK